MKIRKLQLKNIGVFDDETIEFPPCPVKDKAEIHILTGQNGSGKSTILMGLASIFNPDFAHQNKTDSFSTPFFKRFRLFKEDKGKDLELNKLSKNLETLPVFIECFFDNHESTNIRSQRFGVSNIITVASATQDYSRLLRGEDGDFKYAVFAFSGYRQVRSDDVEAIKEPKKFNPLDKSLEFRKDYDKTDQLTINQLIANNISKSAIEKGRNDAKSKKFANVIKSIEQAISEITDWQVEFDLETEPTNLITRVNGQELDFDVLPDGLRSLISWIADLAGRVDLLKWQDDLPIFEKNLILFLDEIEVHLHPAWQRKVLPVVQKLFKNSQIFVSTHSPFVVNSVDDAWVYKLELENGKAKVAEVVRSEDGISYQTVLSEIFGIKEEFGGKTQDDLDKFYRIVRNGKKIDEKELKKLAKSLAQQSEELNTIVQIELRQLSRRKGKEYTL